MFNKSLINGLVIVIGLYSTHLYANTVGTIQCTKENGTDRCVNGDTDASYGFTLTPSFKNYYDIKLLNSNQDCDNKSATHITLPRNSYFKQTNDSDAQSQNAMLVHVYNTDQETDLATTKTKFFSAPFKFCLNGHKSNRVERSYYKRVGGMNTGILVVPFKLRDGNFYSDSTIGPYISYKWESWETMATLGLSKVSTSEIGTDQVTSEDGLTFALGASFEVAKDWDIAFLMGVDHLSGDKGESWQYQDEIWFSFAIGFNFTR
ncbi:hypothetical protein ACMAZF_03500 [Psychrobium sp. nBUS_13]|uniref:hypothetical protein n=1 Tax=Psychrobium sp. nBUS_13 TaxID=3395319 RepID=UPI003EBE1D85